MYGIDNQWLVLAGMWGTVGVICCTSPVAPSACPCRRPCRSTVTWVAGRWRSPDGAKYVGPLDLFTLVVELGVVATTMTMLPARDKARTTNLLTVIGVALATAGVGALLF